MTKVTIERGIAFFEDGTEVSNVSVELVKAAPHLLAALERILRWNANETMEWIEGKENGGGIPPAHLKDAKASIAMAKGESE